MSATRYLREVQYRDSSNLARRADLHSKYGRNPESVYEWFTALVPWPPAGRVLEVGCGPGWLWRAAATRAPHGLHVVLTDLSAGMVGEALPRARATGALAGVQGATSDAQAIPFPDHAFDVALSTYMLYHVPDRERALHELARVLRPDGVLGVITIGRRHLAEIEAVRMAVFGEAGRYRSNSAFPPDVAQPMLEAVFDDVSWHDYDDTLDCTDPEDVVAYLMSSPPGQTADDEHLRRLRDVVAERFAAEGGHMTIRKESGAFICRRPRRPRTSLHSTGGGHRRGGGRTGSR